jgi:hypothetical protein
MTPACHPGPVAPPAPQPRFSGRRGEALPPMTWRDPNDLERFLLRDTRSRWPELIPLARVLVLAPRIEPLLLRNARQRFLPGSDAGTESQLCFSPLVAARSTREIVLHLGIARVLAGQLGGARPWPEDHCPPDHAPPPRLAGRQRVGLPERPGFQWTRPLIPATRWTAAVGPWAAVHEGLIVEWDSAAYPAVPRKAG